VVRSVTGPALVTEKYKILGGFNHHSHCIFVVLSVGTEDI
jgi:hypothetical protein